MHQAYQPVIEDGRALVDLLNQAIDTLKSSHEIGRLLEEAIESVGRRSAPPR